MDTKEELEAFRRTLENRSLYSLLHTWRFSPPGENEELRGDKGEIFGKVLFAKRDANQDEWVAASKRLGW